MKKMSAFPQSTGSPYWLWPAYGITLLALGFLLFYGADKSGYSWSWGEIPAYIFDLNTQTPGPLLQGLWVTVTITATAFIFTLFFGLVSALGGVFGGVIVRSTARFYLESIRNTPLMVQIFVLYFVLGPVLGIDRFWAAVLALALFEGAYLSEIIRSGIFSIPEGQWQVAWNLGFSTPQTLRYIIMPQTGPMLLPPLVSLLISLVKDSALVSTIAIYDLTMQSQRLVSENFLAFEIWLTVAFIYLMMTFFLSWLGSVLEKKVKQPW